MNCRKCPREATHHDPEGSVGRVYCEMHYGYAYADYEHERSQRWIRDKKSRSPNWRESAGWPDPYEEPCP